MEFCTGLQSQAELMRASGWNPYKRNVGYYYLTAMPLDSHSRECADHDDLGLNYYGNPKVFLGPRPSRRRRIDDRLDFRALMDAWR